MDNYKINNKTMAIIPISKNKSQVIEEKREFFVNEKPLTIIENSCEYFGSSLTGRQVGSISIIGSSYKIPIVIEETNNIIFFPTLAAKSNECCWISLSKIENYVKTNYFSKILFKNGYELFLDVSINILKNQIYKSRLLDYTLKKRKNR